MSGESIDVVITWVDGEDQVHAKKLAQCLAAMGIKRPEAAAPTRFNQCGEIDYCVRSIARFAPWVRTIYIVTDEQIPKDRDQWAKTSFGKKIKLIDHRDIFRGFEEHLPTFNSLTIESMLWRIKGLSERFIYFNDDCFLIRPVTPLDFFQEGKCVLRGTWKTQSEQKRWEVFKRGFERAFKITIPLKNIDFFRALQERTARLAGWGTRYFHLPHEPIPLKKKSFDDYFQTYPEILSQNLKYRFRSDQQYSIVALMAHLALKQHLVVLDRRMGSVTVNGACHSPHKIERRLVKAERNKNVAFVCMQSMDAALGPTQENMFEWLELRIGSEIGDSHGHCHLSDR
ncbi:MAG: stealth family protein [Legionellales bacterium]|nr:stealth family protein [Legionellales bacterium]